MKLSLRVIVSCLQIAFYRLQVTFTKNILKWRNSFFCAVLVFVANNEVVIFN